MFDLGKVKERLNYGGSRSSGCASRILALGTKTLGILALSARSYLELPNSNLNIIGCVGKLRKSATTSMFRSRANSKRRVPKEIPKKPKKNSDHARSSIQVMASKTKLYIVLEFVTGGELFDNIVNATLFLYCLVDHYFDAVSTLEFDSSLPRNAVTAPLLQNPGLDMFYYLELKGISVGDEALEVSNASFEVDATSGDDIIVDFGTTVMKLWSHVYKKLREAFVSRMKGLPKVKDVLLFDTCYDLLSKIVWRKKEEGKRKNEERKKKEKGRKKKKERRKKSEDERKE
ncbi:hypothetical protein Fmac_020572 [Flemingia macrophylla]|uniref:Xylanase inhibitor C-terminal domain-containing protein n=1 Tax=Flemingia macrophylla TaxID=520843 RepID=A0ABD1LUG2_9FABA